MSKVEAETMATRIEFNKVFSLKGIVEITTREKGTSSSPEIHANKKTREAIPLTLPTRNVEGTILVNVI